MYLDYVGQRVTKNQLHSVLCGNWGLVRYTDVKWHGLSLYTILKVMQGINLLWIQG